MIHWSEMGSPISARPWKSQWAGKSRAGQWFLAALIVGCLLTFYCPVHAQAPLRRHDDRPKIDLKRAQAAGISRYESKRLVLLTDVSPDKARQVIHLIDQVYAAWEQQLGPVPIARDKSEFQVTGFLMSDPKKFEQAGLVRPGLPRIIHGQHDGYEFWMHEVEYDYYREHLLLHEATHCVMQSLDDGLKPIWFLEGMAEFFGTHETHNSALRFGLVPTSRQSALGFGRIEMIRTECSEGRALTAAEVVKLGVPEFSESRSTPYAWSWAFCTFLARHPQFAADFHTLCQTWETERFGPAFDTFWMQHERAVSAEWEIFRDSLCYGWDTERGASVIDVAPHAALASGEQLKFAVRADRGWQSTGLRVTASQKLDITATGRVVLAQTTKPWESEPSGISIRYSEDRPIGRLLGAILLDEPKRDGAGRCWEFFDLGPSATIEAKSAGTLFLRVNDRWNELGDNSGQYEIQVTDQPQSNAGPSKPMRR